MRTSTMAVAFVAAGLLVGTPTAQAYIVDTGTPSGGFGWSFAPSQYFAGEFSLASSYSLSSVEAWFSNASSLSAGAVTVSLHSDGGNIPGSVLYSQSVAVAARAGWAWRGLTGLTWAAGPGTYWVSFTPDANISGSMQVGAPSPLGEYAQHSGGAWQDAGPNALDYLDIGIRIDGSALSPVPLPAAAWLLLSGLAGLGVLGRRRKTA